MSTRILVYAGSAESLALAHELGARLEAEVSRILCPRYDGPLGPTLALWDHLRGHLPRITVSPAIGPADWVVVGGPVWAAHLAAPLRRLLQAIDHLPPVAGVFVTRKSPRMMAPLEDQVTAARPGQPPAFLCLDAATPEAVRLDRIAQFTAKVTMIRTPVAILRAA